MKTNKGKTPFFSLAHAAKTIFQSVFKIYKKAKEKVGKKSTSMRKFELLRFR